LLILTILGLLPAATAMAMAGTLTPGYSAAVAAAARVTTTLVSPAMANPFGWSSAPDSI